MNERDILVIFEPNVMNTKKNNDFKRKGRFWVYIVECRDGTYYTGFTPDLEKRIELHNSGKGAKYTRDRRPVRLVWCKEYKYFKRAFLEEKRIKRLIREQKEKLVNGSK
jgi:putative endonuclease